MPDTEQKKGRGRPRKSGDPQNTASLFDADGNVSEALTDTYADIDCNIGEDLQGGQGTVEGGGGFTIADRMEYCAKLARGAKSESVRLQAMIKYSELEREQREAEGAGDIGAELLAVIALVKDETPGEVVQNV